MTEQIPVKAPRTIPKPAPKDKIIPVVVDEAPITTRRIVSEGETFEVEVINIDGYTILAKSVYRTVDLPGTDKKTKLLVLAAGTVLH